MKFVGINRDLGWLALMCSPYSIVPPTDLP